MNREKYRQGCDDKAIVVNTKCSWVVEAFRLIRVYYGCGSVSCVSKQK